VKTNHGWVLVAKSANHPAGMPLGDARPQMAQVGRADWLTVTTPLQTAQHSQPVAVVMGYPLEAALGEYSNLIWPMLFIFAAALIFSVVGSLAIARGMAQPLEALAAGARRIAAGDYSEPVQITSDPELAQLSGALVNMTQSIAEREAALTAAVTSVEAARAEAVRANEAKSQFLANMSHELRTPLNAIVGFSEMLSGEVLGPIGTPRYLEYAHDISNSGQHLLSLVAKMLDLAEAEAGRLSLVCEPLPLGPIVQRAVARFAPLARSGGVTITGPETTLHWPAIAGDAAKLELAIGGIIHNAIKFTPSGGQVIITGVRRDTRFSLLVVDTGVGMEERVIATVTRPFQRLRSALDGEQQGAGLGLSFAKAIVTAHDGLLRIDSKLAVGTSVEMDFPVCAMTTSNAA
jgi:signal transduction histidine kinase